MAIAERPVGGRHSPAQNTTPDQEKEPMKRKYQRFIYLLHRLGLKTPGEIYSCQTESELLRVDLEEYLKEIYQESKEAEKKLEIAIGMLDRADEALRRLDTVGFWRFYSLARMWELRAARDFDSSHDNNKNPDLLEERLNDVLVEATRIVNHKQLRKVENLFSREKRSIKDIEKGVWMIYDPVIGNEEHFLKRRIINIQFEFFIIATIMSMVLLHYAVSLEDGNNLLSQNLLNSTEVPPILLLATVSLFGVLGASLSSLLSLSKILSGNQTSTPVGDLRLAFGRLVIGAASAMTVYVFLLSGGQNILTLTYGWILMISFAAGFSERLLLNAVKSVSGEEENMSVTDQRLTELSEKVVQIEQMLGGITQRRN